MMISLSTLTYNPDAPLLIHQEPDSEFDDLSPRVARSATLDGKAVVTPFGFCHGDRTFKIRAKLTEAEDAQLTRLITTETFFTLSCRHGLFLGAIESRTGSGGNVTIKFLVQEKIEYEEPEPETPKETYSAVIPIASGTDDGHWNSSISFSADDGYVSVTRNSMIFYAWLRFLLADIPHTATITSAYISLTADYAYTDGGTAVISIAAVDADSPDAPTSKTEATALELTAETATWEGDDMDWTAGQVYQSPDLASVIQAIINRSGWAAGNALMLILSSAPGTATAEREFKAYESGTPAELHIEYEA